MDKNDTWGKCLLIKYFFLIVFFSLVEGHEAISNIYLVNTIKCYLMEEKSVIIIIAFIVINK